MASLRQDPDILLLGEIRDTETAEIALRAAMTGHLILLTLHTNDAISSALRLIDMGVDEYLVASALRAVVAQRLVRRLCERCKQKTDVDSAHASAQYK
ncbi:MAG: MSHA biogenesis protein MshE [Cellvibrionaceae bacterium]|jgi:MSHA biogenesis protein MshE